MESMSVGRTFGTSIQSEKTGAASRKPGAEGSEVDDSGFLAAMRKQTKLFAGQAEALSVSEGEQEEAGGFQKDRMGQFLAEDLILQGTLGSHAGSHTRIGNLNIHTDRQMHLTSLNQMIENESVRQEALEEKLMDAEETFFTLPEDMAEVLPIADHVKAEAPKYGNGFSLGQEKNVIRDRLASTKKVFENLDAVARGAKDRPTQIDTSMLDMQETATKAKPNGGEFSLDLKRKINIEMDGRSFSESGLLKSLDAAVTSSSSSPAPTTAASRFMSSMVHQLQADSSLFMRVYPEYARVSIEVAKGEKISIEMRMQDGCADVRAVGQAAGILEGKTAELRSALEEAGMMLGEFSLESHDSEADFEDADSDGGDFWSSSNQETDAQETTTLEEQVLNTDNGDHQRRKQSEGRAHWVTA
jgi:hypothetical protein